MNANSNRLVPILLLIGIALCIALLPWGRWFGKSRDELLSERVAEYVQLRLAEDWPAIYSLIDPGDRRIVPMQRFLVLYGSGAIKPLALSEISREVGATEAEVELNLDGELQLDRIPQSARNSLAGHDPAARRQAAPFETKWKWRDGKWWLLLDEQARTGRVEGRPIVPAGG